MSTALKTVVGVSVRHRYGYIPVGTRWAVLVVLIVLLGLGRVAEAHEVQPAYLELRQVDATHVDVLWKVPARGYVEESLTPRLPEGGVGAGGGTGFHAGPRQKAYRSGDNLIERWTLETPAVKGDGAGTSLEGQRVEIDGLATTLADVMVRIVRLDGQAAVTRLNPTQTGFVVAMTGAGTGGGDRGVVHMAGVYTRMGIEHILMGVDHLLFVLGLLLVVKKRWMLLKTITAFTIAHSITLGIATLGFASAPVMPLNAAIALSILFLGPEIVRARRGEGGETSLTIAHPWVVAFAFGLLHGFGFASGLMNLGLSRGEIPLALLLFNVGVEIGQLVFVFVILGLVKAFVTLEIRWPRWVTWVPAYTVGGLGAYWTIQRTLMLMGVM